MTKFTPEQKFLSSGQQYGVSIQTLKSISQVNIRCNVKTYGKIKKLQIHFPYFILGNK